jgi:hypothetical protein
MYKNNAVQVQLSVHDNMCDMTNIPLWCLTCKLESHAFLVWRLEVIVEKVAFIYIT